MGSVGLLAERVGLSPCVRARGAARSRAPRKLCTGRNEISASKIAVLPSAARDLQPGITHQHTLAHKATLAELPYLSIFALHAPHLHAPPQMLPFYLQHAILGSAPAQAHAVTRSKTAHPQA